VPLLDALLRPVLVHQHALVNGAGRAQHEGGGGIHRARATPGASAIALLRQAEQLVDVRLQPPERR
jgi:hypothetical protein